MAPRQLPELLCVRQAVADVLRRDKVHGRLNTRAQVEYLASIRRVVVGGCAMSLYRQSEHNMGQGEVR